MVKIRVSSRPTIYCFRPNQLRSPKPPYSTSKLIDFFAAKSHPVYFSAI